jgi:hypothetical protein
LVPIIVYQHWWGAEILYRRLSMPSHVFFKVVITFLDWGTEARMNLKWADELGSGAFMGCQIIWMRFTAAHISSRKSFDEFLMRSIEKDSLHLGTEWMTS